MGQAGNLLGHRLGVSQMGGEHEREMNLNVQSCVE